MRTTPGAGVLQLGTGRRLTAGTLSRVTTLAAGHGVTLGGNNIPATTARFRLIDGPAVAADGSVYLSDRVDHRVYRIDPAGMLRPS